MKWNDGIGGIHVIQHFPLRTGIPIEVQLDEIIQKLQNPVVLIVNLINHPEMGYSHEIKDTARANAQRRAYLNNALRKYPQTTKIVQEGGENVVLFSDKPFTEE